MDPNNEGNVIIKQSGTAGRGLFARKNLENESVILQEAPLAAMQSLENLQNVLVCAECLGFIGSLESQLAVLGGVPRSELSEYMQAQPKHIISPIVPCNQECGEMYCSQVCCDKHFQRCHRFLCTGPITDEEAASHPLLQFKVHAIQTNEIFLLVAAVICHMISEYDKARGEEGQEGKARASYKDFVQELWWNAAASGPDSDLGRTLMRLVNESCEYLASVLRTSPYASHDAVTELVTPETFSRIIGMFEQNNLGIRSESPVAEALRQVCTAVTMGEEAKQYDSSLGKEEAELSWGSLLPLLEMAAAGGDDCEDSCCSEQEEEETGNKYEEGQTISEQSNDGVSEEEDKIEEGGDEVEDMIQEIESASILDGTALFSIICSMNHSCEPNCRVRYRSEKGQPLLAELETLRPILEGEELFQSYIDKDLPLHKRRAALYDYGFKCQCPKCQRQEVQERLVI